MIWKKHRVLICLCALFALSLLSSVFIHSSASALDTGLVNRTQTNIEKIVRTSWGTDNIEYNTSVGAQNLPWLALGANDGSRTYRYMWGLLLYNDLTSYGYQYEDYTSLTVTIRFGGTAGRNGPVPSSSGSGSPHILNNTTMVIYDDHNVSKEVACTGSVQEQTPSNYVTILQCVANFEVGHNPVGYHIKITPLDSVQLGVYPNYTLGVNDSKNVAVTHIAQQIISDTDPLKALLQEGNVIGQNIANNTQNIYDITNNYYLQEGQDRLDLQDASSDATQDGSSAVSSAQNASSSILSVITGVYNVLLNPTTTNCVLSNVQIYDMNLGNLDFCTGFDIPQPIFAIGALIMVGLIILLAWSILHAGLGLYNQIFGGKS